MHLRRRLRSHALGLALLVPIAMVGLSAGSSAASSGQTSTPAAGVAPNPVSMMDCNGHSPEYKDVKVDLGGLCTDPISSWNGKAYRFVDNGSYVGHDEPSVKFISNAPGSGNSMTYQMRLSTDPTATPTASGGPGSVTDYAELSPAPWFGLPICDPNSYPLNPCTPDSNSNSGQINNPQAAGSAFMELQFYPPGFGPFIDGPSCNPTQWCAALTIDSLEAGYNFANLNVNCEEPVNFAFLQTNGVPAGPPSPQLADVSSFTPNSDTLMMNPGDVLSVTIHDTPNGLLTSVYDHTTGQYGYMVASAANGFMNTNPTTCYGTPFDFHPEYDTAAQGNQVPWAALEGGVLMEQEIGHFEACSSVNNKLAYSSGGFFDPKTDQNCVGGVEAPTISPTGEGPCSFTTGACTGSTTQNDNSCGANANFASGSLCEYSDGICMPSGSRPVITNNSTQHWDWPVAGCQQDYTQNGDLDFDGNSYLADWPNGSSNHPTSFAYSGPVSNGVPYPSIQFETDVAGSEADCNVSTGVGCTAPPAGAAFYPFWSLASSHAMGCVWNFGNSNPATTVNAFGGAAEYGSPDTARYGGTLTSPVMSNPQLNGCGAPTGQAHGNGHHHG